jgi:putative oxidoreductase
LDVGVLLIRLIVGLSLGIHGLQKLFGWFGGRGLRGTAAGFASLGYRPPIAMALLAGTGECAGWLLVAGLAFPLGCAAGVGVMINAVNVAWGRGPRLPTAAYEYPLVMCVVTAGLAFIGPGRLSLDWVLGVRVHGAAWGLGAIAFGIVTAVTVLVGFRRGVAPLRPEGRPAADGSE